jgi:hypothetical protein
MRGRRLVGALDVVKGLARMAGYEQLRTLKAKAARILKPAPLIKKPADTSLIAKPSHADVLRVAASRGR